MAIKYEVGDRLETAVVRHRMIGDGCMFSFGDNGSAPKVVVKRDITMKPEYILIYEFRTKDLFFPSKSRFYARVNGCNVDFDISDPFMSDAANCFEILSAGLKWMANDHPEVLRNVLDGKLSMIGKSLGSAVGNYRANRRKNKFGSS